MTTNDWNVPHVPRPCFIAPWGKEQRQLYNKKQEIKECRTRYYELLLFQSPFVNRHSICLFICLSVFLFICVSVFLYVLYIFASFWMLGMPFTSWNISYFCMKNVKTKNKARKMRQNEAKTCFWGFAPKCWLKLLFPEKKILFHLCVFYLLLVLSICFPHSHATTPSLFCLWLSLFRLWFSFFCLWLFFFCLWFSFFCLWFSFSFVCDSLCFVCDSLSFLFVILFLLFVILSFVCDSLSYLIYSFCCWRKQNVYLWKKPDINNFFNLGVEGTRLVQNWFQGLLGVVVLYAFCLLEETN